MEIFTSVNGKRKRACVWIATQGKSLASNDGRNALAYCLTRIHTNFTRSVKLGDKLNKARDFSSYLGVA